MSAADHREDRLAAAMRRTLRPQRFPSRRDLAVVGGTREDLSASAYFDMFWPANHRFAAIAGRVSDGGVAGALRIAALHRLVRGAVETTADADSALALVSHFYAGQFGDGIDLALAVFDLDEGDVSTARLGAGTVQLPNGIGLARFRPAAGDILFLATLDAPGAMPATVEDGPDDVLRRGLASSLPGTAAVALCFKFEHRRADNHRFALPNDAAAIAGLTERIDALCAKAGVAEAVFVPLGLALDELLTNVISYGFSDGAAHEILLDLEIKRDVIHITIRDDGRAFDPLSLPEPDLSADLEDRQLGGLGMHFVRELLDEVEYRRDKGWNILFLQKRFA